MKFWQKVFFATLVLFLIAVNVLGWILLDRSYSLNKEHAAESAHSEFMIVRQSVYQLISYAHGLGTQLSPDNLIYLISPYAGYYLEQGSYIAVFLDGEQMLNSNPHFAPGVYADSAAFYETGSYLICAVGDAMPQPHEGITLVYMKDISSLLVYRAEMTRVFIWLSIAISLALAVTLLIFIVGLTNPLRKLSATALSIANGRYEIRAPMRGNDEVGQFSRSFNMMADKVQEHIGLLTSMSESKERFINDLAHELRTPITAVAGYAELLKIGNMRADEFDKSVSYIIKQSKRIRDISLKLTDLAYMRDENIERLPVDMGSVIANAQATCQAQMDGKRISLSTDIGDVRITGDACLLESLLQNLIENAVKYSGEGGRICIAAYPENGGAVLTVTDDGIGMDADDIERITEPFYRADKSRSRAAGGVGLGLALCARICKAHDAKLEIDSVPGSGTAVKIYFTTL